MSLCSYNFEKHMMITFAVVATVLIIGLVMLVGNNNTASGQNYAFDPLLTKCVIYHDEHLVVIDLSAEANINCTAYYVAKGYEIKGIIDRPSDIIMYMEKSLVK